MTYRQALQIWNQEEEGAEEMPEDEDEKEPEEETDLAGDELLADDEEI